MAWLLGLFAALFVVGRGEVHRFETLAAQAISSTLTGDKRKVEVRADVGPEGAWGDVHSVRISGEKFSAQHLPLYTEPKGSKKGILRSLSLSLHDFTLGGLHVASLDATIPDCRFDFALAAKKGQMVLTHSGTGPGEVVLTEADIERFILVKFHEVQTVHVHLDHDRATIEGHGEFVAFDADFWIVAKLEPVDGVKLAFGPARVLIDNQLADPAAQASLIQLLNPILDLDHDLDLHGAISIDAIRLDHGELHATGQVRIPDDPGSFKIKPALR